MAQTRKSRLWDACSNAIAVRFWNRYDLEPEHGYILDIGTDFFLFLLINDSLRFEGFECHLIADIKRLEVPDPFEDFIVAALRRRGECLDRAPEVDLSSVTSILNSATKLFPLVVIELGRKKKGVCFVGHVVDVSKGRMLMLEIDPHAVWEKKPSRFWLKDITRVSFGGGYEEALHLVGGDPYARKFAKDGSRVGHTKKKVVKQETSAR
jgi:hypothetical protein